MTSHIFHGYPPLPPDNPIEPVDVTLAADAIGPLLLPIELTTFWRLRKGTRGKWIWMLTVFGVEVGCIERRRRIEDGLTRVRAWAWPRYEPQRGDPPCRADFADEATAAAWVISTLKECEAEHIRTEAAP